MNGINVDTWAQALSRWQEGWKGRAIAERCEVLLGSEVPRPSLRHIVQATGFTKGERELKLWAHTRGAETTPEVMHYIAVQGSTGVHNDPAYATYTHHLKLTVSPGITVRGLHDRLQLRRGSYYVLRAHEPHEVRGTNRNGINFGVAFDSDRVWPAHEIIPMMLEFAAKTPL